MLKLLITGATGFIGKHLLKALFEQGHQITCIVRADSKIGSIKNYTHHFIQLNDLDFKLNDYDGIIHLASLYLKDHKPTEISNLIASNIEFPTQILEARALAQSKAWFINTGTFWQYYQDQSYSPVNLYAATKQAFNDVAAYYQQVHQQEFYTLKLCDTYGPGDTRPKILNLLYKTMISGDTLKMSGGEQLMNLSFIDDVVSAYCHLIDLIEQKSLKENSFKVSAPKIYTLKEIVFIMEETFKKKINIQWGALPYRAREVMIPWTGGIELPSLSAKTPLQDGLRKTFTKI